MPGVPNSCSTVGGADTERAWLTTRSVSADLIPESLLLLLVGAGQQRLARRSVSSDGGLRPGEVHEQRRRCTPGTSKRRP